MERVRGPFFRVANPAHIARIEITLADPAVLVVLRHALLGEPHHLIERARAACVEEGLEADHLVAACVVAALKLVPANEFRIYLLLWERHGKPQFQLIGVVVADIVEEIERKIVLIDHRLILLRRLRREGHDSGAENVDLVVD